LRANAALLGSKDKNGVPRFQIKIPKSCAYIASSSGDPNFKLPKNHYSLLSARLELCKLLTCCSVNELELIKTQMAQKQMLWAEVCARALSGLELNRQLGGHSIWYFPSETAFRACY
jgi:hypothetical protein